VNLNGLVMLLPYIDQAGLYNKLDFNEAFDDYMSTLATLSVAAGLTLSGGTAVNNAAVVNRVMPAFTCPSDPGPDTASTSTTYNLPGGEPEHRTNYDFVVYRSSYLSCNLWKSRGTVRSMFEDGSYCRIRDITDGTTNTAMMAETRKACCANGSNANWGGRGWVQIGLSLRSFPPNLTTRITSGVLTEYKPKLGEWGSTGSYHVGGIHILLADGSTRFLSDNVDLAIRTNLEQIADGNVLDAY
jgi:hypothetical protein